MGETVSAYRRESRKGTSVSIRYFCRKCMRGGSRLAVVQHLRHFHGWGSIAANREASEALADLKSREADRRERGLA